MNRQLNETLGYMIKQVTDFELEAGVILETGLAKLVDEIVVKIAEKVEPRMAMILKELIAL